MKKMRLFLLKIGILLVFSYGGIAQSNYIPPKRDFVSQERYVTYTKMLKDNFVKEKTYVKFEGMYTSRIPYHVYYKNLAICYSNLGEPADSVFTYFEKALRLDSIKSCSTYEFYWQHLVPNNKLVDWRKLDSVKFDYYKTVCDKCLTIFRTQLKKEREEVEKDTSYNHVLIKELKTMFTDDQYYRKQMNGVTDKETLAMLWQLQTENDKKNEAKLADIFDKYGYPTKKLVSQYHYTTAVIILLHTPSTFQRQYLPVMRQAFKNKDIGVMDMTMLLDKIWAGESRKQIFGTQSSTTGGSFPKLDKETSIKVLQDLDLKELIVEL